MADNVAITAGSGTTVAADEVTDGTLGTAKVQYVKLMDGTLDGTSKAAVGANGLAVDVKNVTGTVAVSDAARANTNVTLAASASYTTVTTQSFTFNLDTFRGCYIFWNVSANGSAVTLTPKIDIQDPVSLSWANVLAPTATTTAALFTYLLYPNAAAAGAGVTASAGFPGGYSMRFTVTAGSTTSVTYSVGLAKLI